MENIILIPIMIFVFAFGFFVADLLGRTPDERRRGGTGRFPDKRNERRADRRN